MKKVAGRPARAPVPLPSANGGKDARQADGTYNRGARGEKRHPVFLGIFKTLTLLFLVASFSPNQVSGSDITFTAEADKAEVAMDDAVSLRVTLSGSDLNGARPVPPDMPGFRTASSGQSQNISFVNGRVSSSITFTYTLQPLSPGDHVIPAFTVRVGGQTLSTEPIPVKVVPAGGSAAPRASPSAPVTASPPPPGSESRGLFLTASLNKKTGYVGEPLTLSVRFYSRVPLLSQPSYAPPSLTGFLMEDLPPQRQFTENIRGGRYTVIELMTALFPAAPGTATVGPAALECRINDFSNDRMNDPFGSSFFRHFFDGGKPVVLRSKPVHVQVLPLPAEGKPVSFRGDVGTYRISAALDRGEASLHEPVTLTITVEGEGNIKALSTPELPALVGFKTYETLSSLNISKNGWKVQGSKVFKTVLKPEVSGQLSIPSIPFSFFDPGAKTFRTLRTERLPLTVHPGEEGPAGPTSSVQDVKVISQDIRYLKSGPPIRRAKPFHRTRAFLWINGLPVGGFLFLTGLLALRRRSPSPDAAARRARAEARGILKRAAPRLKEGDVTGYLAALEKSLRAYWAAKTSTAAAALTWEEMAKTLDQKHAAPRLVDQLNDLWEGLQRARYMPGLVTAEEAKGRGTSFEKLLPELESLW